MDTITISKKVCSKCHTEQDLDEFHRNPSTSDGRDTRCKRCVNLTKKRIKAESAVPVTQELDLGDYIRRRTQEGKMLTRANLAIVETVDNNPSDRIPTYRGITITGEMYNKALDWLTKNGWGNPSQRKASDDKIKRTEGELVERLRFLVKKVVRKESVAEKILVLLGEAGL